MDKAFWTTRWDEGQLAFHQTATHPALLAHWEDFLGWSGRSGSRPGALVPLCGKTLDITWLAERCERVVGVEFVEKAVRDYFASQGTNPTVTANPTVYSHEHTRLIVSDYFAVRSEDVGPVQVAYDRGALVAIPPERRLDYVMHTGRLLGADGSLFSICFEHDGGSGPPFSMDDVPALFERSAVQGVRYRIERISSADILDDEPRFRERGCTYLREVLWFAKRVP